MAEISQLSQVEKEKGERKTDKEIVDGFVDNLVSAGYCRVNIPERPDRNFVITFRYGNNPALDEQTIAMSKFIEYGRFRHGYTSMVVLDLLEQDTNTGSYKPVGHRDYRIANFGDSCVANGNFAANREDLPEFRSTKFQTSLEASDEEFGGASENGVEVAEPLRRKGLGKFLMAVSFELLSRQGVTEIDLSGSVSESLEPIVGKFGYSKSNKRLNLDEVLKTDYRNLITPFC